jgi:hypothetical protein
MLMFQTFIHSWVCYECLKVLLVFGLQPSIRTDIQIWSTDLHAIFNYYTDKSGNKEYLGKTQKSIDILFLRTNHFSYFDKLPFGNKTKFDLNSGNPIVYLVVLTWMRQLQQFFYELDETDDAADWNDLGRYWGNTVQAKEIGLSYINMATVNSDEHTLVTNVSQFKPNETRHDVVSSLEQWAAMILKPILSKKQMNIETSDRVGRAYLQTHTHKYYFKINDTDYTNTRRDKTTTSPAKSPLLITFVLDTPPEKHNSKSESELLYSICNCLKASLAMTNNTTSSKKRLSVDDNNAIKTTKDGVSSFIALVNKTDKTSFGTIDETYDHLNKKIRPTVAHLADKDDSMIQSNESSESDSEEDPPHKSEETSSSSSGDDDSS